MHQHRSFTSLELLGDDVAVPEVGERITTMLYAADGRPTRAISAQVAEVSGREIILFGTARSDEYAWSEIAEVV
jgi:hypothetical protein